MSSFEQVKTELRRKAIALLDRVPTKRVDISIAIVMTIAAMVVYAFVFVGGNSRAFFTFLENIELRSIDSRFKVRGPRPTDDRIVIVDIDEKTMQHAGAYPIPRSELAALVDKLSQGGAKVVSFDMNFPTPEKNSAVKALERLQQELPDRSQASLEKIKEIERQSDNDQMFAESLKKAGNVVLGHLFLSGKSAEAFDYQHANDDYQDKWTQPFPQVLKVQGKEFDMNRAWVMARGGTADRVSANISLLAEQAKDFGFFDIDPDDDGTVRRSETLIRYSNADWYPSLELQTIRQFENIKEQSCIAYMGPLGLEYIELGSHTYKTNSDGTILVNFAGPFESYKHYSIADVVEGAVVPSTFRDKIVYVGATAKAAGDLRSIPFQKSDANYMGVEIHANVTDNLLHENESGRGYLTRGSREEMIDYVVLVALGLGMGWLFGKIKPLHATGSLIVALALFALLAQMTFSKLGMVLNVVMPVGLLVVDFASITSYRLIFEEREKRKVRKTFERYVSPGVIRLIEQDPKKYFKAGGEMKELTIMFSDIRSFTTISEGLTPTELVLLLNEYLGEMTDILFKRWGTLDKYIGDALMGFWGSPFPQDDHAIRSCACALDMSARLQELNLNWESQGKRPLAIGIGINSGPVNVGNMGSDRRFAWTVMGDHVNLASRLEGMTKKYHSERVVSEFTYALAKDHYIFRDLDRIRVKGKLKPVAIYELMGWAKDEAKFAERLRMYGEAKAAYDNHSWDEAIQRFESVLTRYPNDGASEVLLERCLEFRRNAPQPDWDGVYVMESK